MDAPAVPTMLSREEVFVDLVSFKWLMAPLGCWVDLPRMRCDNAYACECAARGLAASCTLLQQRSREVLAMLQGPRTAEPA
jgi:hypothetical protein